MSNRASFTSREPRAGASAEPQPSDSRHTSPRNLAAGMRGGGPIFVVGCARSGTTLLQELPDRQAGIAIAPETHHVRRYWTQDRYGDLSRVEQRMRLAHDITNTPVFREMGLDRGAFISRLLDSARSHADVFGVWLQMYGEARGASRVGEKTPHHLLHARLLAAAFPGAAMVAIRTAELAAHVRRRGSQVLRHVG